MKNFTLPDYPEINATIPDCSVAVIETYCRYVYKIPNLDRFDATHSFLYQKKSDSLAIDARNDLNVSLHSDRSINRSGLNFLNEYYGLDIQRVSITALDELLSIVQKNASQGIPTVCNFNMGFLAQRREYHEYYEDGHVIAIIGYNEHLGAFITCETLGGLTTIPMSDFSDCHRYNVEHYGHFDYFSISRSHGGRKQSQAEIRVRIERNLGNLLSDDDGVGLRGLERMIHDATRFIATSAAQFGIPGQWILGFERRAVGRWVETIFDDLELDTPLRHSLAKCYADLYSLWSKVNFYSEKGFLSKDYRDSHKAVGMIVQAFPLEREAARLWQEFLKSPSK